MKLNCFLLYQLMYLILEALYDEKPNDNIAVYLSEANPYLYNDKASADMAVYSEFEEKYNKDIIIFDEFGYSFVLKYLKELSYYKQVYDVFCSITKEDYILTCENILKNSSYVLKK